MVPWNKNSSATTVVYEYIEQDTPTPQSTTTTRVHVAAKPQTLQPKQEENIKGSIRLPLGHYKSCILPLGILFFTCLCGYLNTMNMRKDPRVDSWFLMESFPATLIVAILYVVFSIVWGPKMMEGRKAFEINGLIKGYNAFQVCLSAYMFIEVGSQGWWFDYSYKCQPFDLSNNPKELRIASVTWVYTMSKILDFLDTVFFVMKKKWSNISLLHIVHHSCLLISSWFGARYAASGHVTFFGFLNSAVHAIMYSYYFLAACGPAMRPYLWWKKYLTTIQLAQFAAVFFHAAQLFFRDCPQVPIGFSIWTMIYAVLFFGLFTDYYLQEYKSKKVVPKGKGDNANAQNSKCIKADSKPSSHANGHANGHAITASSLPFSIDSCLKERTSSKLNPDNFEK